MSSEAEPSRTRRRKWLRRGLALSISLLVVDQLFYWTVLTRPVGTLAPLIELCDGDDPPYYQLRANLDGEWRSWGEGNITRIHTNSSSYRDPERSRERVPGVARVVATGDSVSFGIGVEDDQSTPRVLEALLTTELGAPVEVWNAGVPGYSMADHLAVLDGRIMSLEPDVVVLQLGRNDSAVPMPLRPGFMTLMRVSGFARAWMMLRFNFYRRTELFERSFAAYLETLERTGVELVIWHQGLPDDSDAFVRELADAAGVPIVACSGEGYPDLPDDPHLSVEGNRACALTLAPLVRERLRTETDRAAPPD